MFCLILFLESFLVLFMLVMFRTSEFLLIEFLDEDFGLCFCLSFFFTSQAMYYVCECILWKNLNKKKDALFLRSVVRSRSTQFRAFRV
jgi:hypothetical protein